MCRLMLHAYRLPLHHKRVSSSIHASSCQEHPATVLATCSYMDLPRTYQDMALFVSVPGWISTVHHVWIPWPILIHPTSSVAKHPSMPKFHFSRFTLVFDHAQFVSKTVLMVYLTSPADRDGSVHHYAILYSDLPSCLEDL
jgi:hypothetical protein